MVAGRNSQGKVNGVGLAQFQSVTLTPSPNNRNEVKRMKYESMTLDKRNKKVIRYHERHPELSMKEIGEHFISPITGKPLSPQRVHAIIKRHRERMAQNGQ